MIRMTRVLSLSLLLGAAFALGAMAQQITGTPGSPSATTTIDGKQILAPRQLRHGLGIAKGGSGELKVDGKVVATQKLPNSLAFLQVADEPFDVGIDTRTGVNDKDYKVPFAFNGKIDQLTVKLGPPQYEREVVFDLQRSRTVRLPISN
jgi:hypothetical protein